MAWHFMWIICYTVYSHKMSNAKPYFLKNDYKKIFKNAVWFSNALNVIPNTIFIFSGGMGGEGGGAMRCQNLLSGKNEKNIS